MFALYSALRVPNSTLPIFLLFAALGPLFPCPAQDDPFAAGVRTTPWLSPADEQKAFKLPPGFEINLVAAEPDIQKPLNMAFDEKGRIWLTNTVEYPYAAPPDRVGKDTIKVLEDTDGDGRFEKVTTFADGLNIPMGIYPWKGGCIAFSIPNIWHFEDTDADGVCDKRTVLYGPFDTSRDTHGMINSLRRGWDGWIYACHGFNNDSRVKGKDGYEIHMQSGNVFRFQLDGSRIEHFTHGQVNPFGMCFDELFNVFTADCHSKPIYQLLRGGYYPSFGKPHDGLGFVPPMMDHTHGSTAICGLVKYSGENFPEEYRGDFYSGNVMTSRINRNKPQYHGSTIKAIEQPDFLTAGDPWFRPVDIHIGPDGAMYILDFYNRIIGHYEVPLPHPGRDRTSGRIWRLVYKGDDPKTKPAKMRVFGESERKELFNTGRPFEEGPLPWRLQVMHKVLDDTDTPQGLSTRGVLNIADPVFQGTDDPTARILWLWLFKGLVLEPTEEIANGLRHQSPIVRTHVMRMLAEREDWGWNELARIVAVTGLQNGDPSVVRAAADALGRHPDPANIKPIIEAFDKSQNDDSLLRYGLLRALSHHIGALAHIADFKSLNLDDTAEKVIASTCMAVPKPIAAAILTRYLELHDDNALAYLQHAARYADSALIADVVRVGRAKVGSDVEFQAQVIQSLANGLAQRGEPAVGQLQDWATSVATALLATDDQSRLPWTAVPIDGLPPSDNPWVIEARPSRDGDRDSLFFYSLPKGEQRTGIYRSATFAIPEKLSFWCAGHSGYPGQPLNDGNYIRLRDAKTHEILAASRPPRNDTARQFSWDLGKHLKRDSEALAEPRLGYVELVDGDTASAYAWLAVGRFSISALNPSDAPKKQQLAAEIIGKLKLASFRPRLASLIADSQTHDAARTAIGQALVTLEPDSRAAALVAVLNDAAIPFELRPRMGYAITVRNDQNYLDNLREVMQRIPTRLQGTLAEILAGDFAGAGALLTLIESGHTAPRLLLLPNVINKLAALKSDAVTQRVNTITAKLPPANAVLDALITDRRRAFNRATTNTDRGQAVLTKHCAACHQLEGKGTVLGPQLDGIGNRGIDRLMEDILDPNRNVDVAFRTTTLRLTDGRVVSGLIRREEASQLILADPQGKEFSVAKGEIDAQQKTDLSLMPANVSEIIPAEEFFDLIGYLLTKRVAPKATTDK